MPFHRLDIHPITFELFIFDWFILFYLLFHCLSKCFVWALFQDTWNKSSWCMLGNPTEVWVQALQENIVKNKPTQESFNNLVAIFKKHRVHKTVNFCGWNTESCPTNCLSEGRCLFSRFINIQEVHSPAFNYLNPSNSAIWGSFHENEKDFFFLLLKKTNKQEKHWKWFFFVAEMAESLHLLLLRLFLQRCLQPSASSFFYPITISKPGWYLGSIHCRIKPNSKLKWYNVNFEVNMRHKLYF